MFHFFLALYSVSRSVVVSYVSFDGRATRKLLACGREAARDSAQTEFRSTLFRHFRIEQLYFRNASVSKNTCRTPFTRALVFDLFLWYFGLLFFCANIAPIFSASLGNDGNMHEIRIVKFIFRLIVFVCVRKCTRQWMHSQRTNFWLVFHAWRNWCFMFALM